MRAVMGLACAGLGILGVVIAVILPGYVIGRITRFPLSEYEMASLTATGASYLSPSTLAEIRGADLVVTSVLAGNPAEGTSGVAVWRLTISAYDLTNHQLLAPMSRTFAFDRVTARLAACCGAGGSGDPASQQGGIAGFVFPAGTRKQVYDVYDSVAGQPEPFAYSGTDSVDGIGTYRFTESLSAAAVGRSAFQPGQPELYTARCTYWIDPETGALLKVIADEDLYYAPTTAGAPVTHLFDGRLSATPSTVAALARADAGARDKISAVHGAARLALGLAGGLLAAALLLLARDLRDGTMVLPGGRAARRGRGVPRPPPAPSWESRGSAAGKSLLPSYDDDD
jgi:hypothetical protein